MWLKAIQLGYQQIKRIIYNLINIFTFAVDVQRIGRSQKLAFFLISSKHKTDFVRALLALNRMSYREKHIRKIKYFVSINYHQESESFFCTIY